MKKKIIALLMAVVSCFSLGATASAAENPEQTFKDVEPGTWYYEGVEYVNDLGLMTGMGRVFCGIGKRKIIGKENLRRRWKFLISCP